MRPWQGSLLGGALLAAAFPPMPAFTAVLAIPGLWLLIRSAEQAASGRAAMARVYPGLLLWNVATTYWLAMATVGGGVAAILANAAVMSIPFGLYRRWWTEGRHPMRNAAVFASLWILFEWGHHQWDLAWPWLTLGNAFSNAVPIIQYIEYTGVLGVSTWVVFTAFLLPWAWNRRDWRLSMPAFLPPALSLLLLAMWTDAPVGRLNTLLVQPNFDSYQRLSGFRTEAEALDSLLAIIEPELDGSVDVVMMPENSLEGWVYPNIDAFPNNRLAAEAASRDVAFIGGGTYFKSWTAPEAVPFPHRTAGNGLPYGMYNAGMAWYADGGMQVYGKRRLVPLVERLPFAGFFARVVPWEGWLEWLGFEKGRESAVMRTAPHTVTALVCYDSVFPDWVRRNVKDGGAVIGIITNDGWWGDTGGHEQHFAYARLRAIETRRSVARSANNGISGVILPDGSVSVRTGYWTQAVIRASVPVYGTMTVYTRFGDWIVWLVMAAGVWGAWTQPRIDTTMFRRKS